LEHFKENMIINLVYELIRFKVGCITLKYNLYIILTTSLFCKEYKDEFKKTNTKDTKIRKNIFQITC
jgi:hypothetical protein